MGKISSFLIFRQVLYTKHWNLNLLKENVLKNTEKERLNRWFNIGMASFYVKGLHLSQGRLSLLLTSAFISLPFTRGSSALLKKLKPFAFKYCYFRVDSQDPT